MVLVMRGVVHCGVTSDRERKEREEGERGRGERERLRETKNKYKVTNLKKDKSVSLNGRVTQQNKAQGRETGKNTRERHTHIQKHTDRNVVEVER